MQVNEVVRCSCPFIGVKVKTALLRLYLWDLELLSRWMTLHDR